LNHKSNAFDSSVDHADVRISSPLNMNHISYI